MHFEGGIKAKAFLLSFGILKKQFRNNRVKSNLEDTGRQFNKDIAFLLQEIGRLVESFIYFMIIT